MFLSILNAVYVFPNCQFLTPSLFILHSQTCWKQLEPHNEVGGKGGNTTKLKFSVCWSWVTMKYKSQNSKPKLADPTNLLILNISPSIFKAWHCVIFSFFLIHSPRAFNVFLQIEALLSLPLRNVFKSVPEQLQHVLTSEGCHMHCWPGA